MSLFRYSSVVVGAAWLMCLAVAPPVVAQSGERHAAAEAYDRGMAAYLTGDYLSAAKWFETAHRHFPKAEALIQAVRSYEKGGRLDRAATLGLALLQRYSDDEAAVTVGEGLLRGHRDALLLVHARCADCSIEVDGSVTAGQVFFVTPGEPHMAVAGFPDGKEIRRTVEGRAGDELTIEFEPPTADAVELAGMSQRDTTEVDGDKPLDPVVVHVGAGLTAALLALSIGVSAAAAGGVDGYEAAAKSYRDCIGPCTAEERLARDALEDGEGREQRANIAWAATAVAAVATAAVAVFFTNWELEAESEREGIRLGATPEPHGGLSGRLAWVGQF